MLVCLSVLILSQQIDLNKMKKFNLKIFFNFLFSTGDITQKGYEKKRTRLLQPYIQKNAQQGKNISVFHLILCFPHFTVRKIIIVLLEVNINKLLYSAVSTR